jgi:hypothetical protein
MTTVLVFFFSVLTRVWCSQDPMGSSSREYSNSSTPTGHRKYVCTRSRHNTHMPVIEMRSKASSAASLASLKTHWAQSRIAPAAPRQPAGLTTGLCE